MAKKAPPPPVREAPRREILSNPRVRAWYEARCLRSRLSADTDLRKLGLLLERLSLDPESIVTLAGQKPDDLQEALIRYATQLKRAGRLDAYIVKTLSGLKSYLRFRRVKFDGYPELSPIQGSTLATERVPTQAELGGVLDRLSLRGRVIALFLAHTGVRPQVLGDYTGERGLTLGDLPELKLGAEPKFTELPFVARVPANLSKTRVSYVTFGTGQLASTMLSYLKERRERGERLGPSSPVIARLPTEELRGVSRRSVSGERRFMVTTALLREVAERLHLLQPDGVRWRAYVLRSYCSTRLLLAEGEGKIGRDLREAILGHDTGVAGRYSVGKRWGEELLAEARRQYRSAASYLETTTEPKADVVAEVKRALLEVANLDESEKARYAHASREEILRVLRERLLGAAELTPAPLQANAPVQRPVPLHEVDRMMQEGWKFVAHLGTDRVILESPNS